MKGTSDLKVERRKCGAKAERTCAITCRRKCGAKGENVGRMQDQREWARITTFFLGK